MVAAVFTLLSACAAGGAFYAAYVFWASEDYVSSCVASVAGFAILFGVFS